MVRARYFTDPFCPRSWAAEPALRRLEWEFGEGLELVPVMGGLARAFGPEYADTENDVRSGPVWAMAVSQSWLRAGAESSMPVDPRNWGDGPPAGSFVSCMAVIAAREQGTPVAMSVLRRLRLAAFCERARLDSPESVVSEALGLDGLDDARFRIDLASTAILEAFGADLDLARGVPEAARRAEAFAVTEGKERVAFPSIQFLAGAGAAGDEAAAAWGPATYETWREAAVDAGAKPLNSGPLEPLEALTRFGRLATAELIALAQRPRPPVEAELWRLATEWRLKPVPVLGGTLWDLA